MEGTGMRLGVGILAVLVAQSLAPTAEAHEGPPFPLFMDRPVGELRVSLWADPDIGEAQFFVIVETSDGEKPSVPLEVTLWAEPTSGRLERAEYATELQPQRNQLLYAAQPYFDQRDFWNVGVQLVEPDGADHELVTEVESTPPGFGPWDLLIYLFPFLLIGGLWISAMLHRRRGEDSRMHSDDGSGETHSEAEGSKSMAEGGME